jgi:hypothetical protein
MKKHLFTLGVVAAAILLATSAYAANRGVEFTGIGFIDDPGDWPASTIWDVSGDGSTFIAGTRPYGGDCNLLSYPELDWTYVGDDIYNQCLISKDGSKVVADIYLSDLGYNRSGVWNGTPNDWTWMTEPDDFVPCPSSGMSVKGVSATGAFTTGLTWVTNCKGRGYLWDGATDTSINLGALNGRVGRGNEVSADGSTIGGWAQGCFDWRGARWDDGTWSYVDGQPDAEAKVCVESGANCCSDTDCPEYVDDSTCSNAGACDQTGIDCVDNVCTGGANAGQHCFGPWSCAGFCTSGPNTGGECTGDYACPGTCVGGANDGNVCTGEYECPDTPVCADNPSWVPENYKGEVTAMTPDGRFLVGIHYGDAGTWGTPSWNPLLWATGYIQNPDGSFTMLPPPPGADIENSYWVPTNVSDDGSIVIGTYGSWGGYPVLWSAQTGTIDLQFFLVGQDLSDLWYWYLTAANALSSDGMVIGGHGQDPPGSCSTPFGDQCTEGYIVDISNVKVCHKPGDHNERTLTISWSSVGDHLGHGDYLATCEFGNQYGAARGADMRPEPPQQASARNRGGSDLHHNGPLSKQDYVRQLQWLQGVTFGGTSAPVMEGPSTTQGTSQQAERPATETIRVERNRKEKQR